MNIIEGATEIMLALALLASGFSLFVSIRALADARDCRRNMPRIVKGE